MCTRFEANQDIRYHPHHRYNVLSQGNRLMLSIIDPKERQHKLFLKLDIHKFPEEFHTYFKRFLQEKQPISYAVRTNSHNMICVIAMVFDCNVILPPAKIIPPKYFR